MMFRASAEGVTGGEVFGFSQSLLSVLQLLVFSSQLKFSKLNV